MDWQPADMETVQQMQYGARGIPIPMARVEGFALNVVPRARVQRVHTARALDLITMETDSEA
jgi:hypothetical protein